MVASRHYSNGVAASHAMHICYANVCFDWSEFMFVLIASKGRFSSAFVCTLQRRQHQHQNICSAIASHWEKFAWIIYMHILFVCCLNLHSQAVTAKGKMSLNNLSERTTWIRIWKMEKRLHFRIDKLFRSLCDGFSISITLNETSVRVWGDTKRSSRYDSEQIIPHPKIISKYFSFSDQFMSKKTGIVTWKHTAQCSYSQFHAFIK